MDSRRLIVFIVLSLGLLLLWQKYVMPQQETNKANSVSQSISGSQDSAIPGSTNSSSTIAQNSNLGKIITVTTDVVQAQISTKSGDLRSVDLLNHGSNEDKKQPYSFLSANDKHFFIAQSGLVSNSQLDLPNHDTIFNTNSYNYVLKPGQNSLIVSLDTEKNGVKIIKTYTFKRNDYVVDVSYQIQNDSANSLSGISAYWRMLRDQNSPDGEPRFVHTFTGAAYYTDDAKFNTIKFSAINKNDLSYPENVNNGWIGFIQHYFAALWLLNPYDYQRVCSNGVKCRFNIRPEGDLASVGLLTDLPNILPHSNYKIAVPLFIGPEAYNVLATTAAHLELTKDYGWVYIFATPLFWLLVKLFGIVKNWGYAIILLTLVVKMVLYPLTRASYISMAKMKALAPKIEDLKKQHGDDRTKLQTAMMQLYKSEKVNPIGGCLPMVLQIPVFLGLYWALLSSVELRQASFFWVSDLSKPDPFYILPVILAITMFLQTFLNPPPADPAQAKMMRIMPIAFSVMFFFFPAGLVLYWLVNNLLTMLQQWYVNNHVTLRRQNREKHKR